MFSISECGSKSIITNAFINSKIDQKNLTFGIDKEKDMAKKCRHIHAGKANQFCPNLKANNATIPKVNKEKYLGDIVSFDGTMKHTIKSREAKGIGAIVETQAL